MCRLTDALRRLLGIHEYRPISTTRASVRRKVGYGARSSNGHAPGLPAFKNPMIERLTREHRIIRQMVNDVARRWTTGR